MCVLGNGCSMVGLRKTEFRPEFLAVMGVSADDKNFQVLSRILVTVVENVDVTALGKHYTTSIFSARLLVQPGRKRSGMPV